MEISLQQKKCKKVLKKFGRLEFIPYICSMEKEQEDLRMVKVQVATCPKCGGAVMVAVKHTMDKYTIKEFADLMKEGCDIHTTNVIVARTIRWCESKCEFRKK